jgi:hypothetical protein
VCGWGHKGWVDVFQPGFRLERIWQTQSR